MKKPEESKFNFILKSVELIYSELKTLNNFNSKPKFLFDIEASQRINPSESIIMVGIEVVILDSNNEDNRLGAVMVACFFEIADFDNVVTKVEERKFIVDDYLLHNLVNVTYSTTRGVMYSQFRGTILHNAFLPITDASTLLKINEKIGLTNI